MYIVYMLMSRLPMDISKRRQFIKIINVDIDGEVGYELHHIKFV